MDKGVLTGCDERQEYLLKWWWKNYTEKNNYPVAFCDFGMTLSARKWCESKGTIINQKTIPMQNLAKETDDTPWKETLFPLMWNDREAWFKKAFVQKQSPFDRSIWVDLDCEVKKDLQPLFDIVQAGDGFAVAYQDPKEQQYLLKRKLIRKGTPAIQAGVFAYRKNSPIIPAWIEWCQTNHHIDFTDESCLSELLHQKDFDIVYLSQNFNWRQVENPSPHAFILHHASATRKRNLLPRITFD